MKTEQSLVAEGREGQSKPSSEPSFNVDDHTRLKNATLILETLEKRGSNSRTRTLLHTYNSSSRPHYVVLEELIDIGAIDEMELNGARTWISITDKGRRILRKWRQFKKAFNGKNRPCLGRQ